MISGGPECHPTEPSATSWRTETQLFESASGDFASAMLAHLALQIHRRAVPETQGDLVAEMQQWFIDRSPKAEAPDERSIRRRITPLWQAMHERA